MQFFVRHGTITHLLALVLKLMCAVSIIMCGCSVMHFFKTLRLV